MDHAQIITTDPDKRSGKPCIRDLRIPAAGMTKGEILADFPDPTETDIEACLAYSGDTR
jgi:uncharacterized protein (DUF433 family)